MDLKSNRLSITIAQSYGGKVHIKIYKNPKMNIVFGLEPADLKTVNHCLWIFSELAENIIK